MYRNQAARVAPSKALEALSNDQAFDHKTGTATSARQLARYSHCATLYYCITSQSITLLCRYDEP